jgi:type IV pilus assembly protein PilE
MSSFALSRRARAHGFTLIELMITVAVIAILAAIAMPSYTQYVIRSSRQAAQSELTELSAIQEKIYLNSNAYSANVSTAYSGQSGGGLGVPNSESRDRKYTLSVTVSGGAYTLTATPVSGSTQANDGNLSINSSGQRAWGTATW